MKKLHYIIALTFLSYIGMSQTEIEKPLESFENITLSGAVNVKYKQSAENKIEITSGESDLKNIDYYIQDNTLFISSKGSFKTTPIITVYNPSIKEVSTSGASNLSSVKTLTFTNFSINALGASNIKLDLSTMKLKIIASGASNINLNGNVNQMEITSSGASSIKAYDLFADTCTISASGASSTKLNVLKKITINANGASTVKFKGDPKEVAAEGGTSSKIMKIGSDNEFTNSNPQDSSKNKTTFKYKNKQIIIIDNDDPQNDSIKHQNTSDLTRKHWQGFWMGFAGYTNADKGFTMTAPNKYMELDYGRSYNFQFNIAQKNLNIYKKYIQLSTGFGFQASNLSFENRTRLNADSSYTNGVIDSTGSYTYRKNKFKQTYLVVPLLLNFNTNKSLKHNFHFTCGVVGKYLLSSKTKQILIRHSDQYTFKRKDSYNLNPFQLDAYASVGYRNVTVFAQYGLTEMFKSAKGPQLTAFSAGIRLVSFD